MDIKKVLEYYLSGLLWRGPLTLVGEFLVALTVMVILTGAILRTIVVSCK